VARDRSGPHPTHVRIVRYRDGSAGNTVVVAVNKTAASLLDGADIGLNNTEVLPRKIIDNKAYAFTFGVNPNDSEIVATTQTGDISVSATTVDRSGWLLKLVFTQDGVGGHTIVFSSDFTTNFTANTSANAVNTFVFICDGTQWVQESFSSST